MMIQTMRWFGPDDPVGLSAIRQAGCTGVVTTLHDAPNGVIWPVDATRARQAEVAAAGLMWEVVESLPVHEAIKTRAPDRDRYVEAYRDSLANLAACGIATVTYNFMPVLDWTRTDLAWPLPSGARALRFDLADVAAYDAHLLRRPGAERDYDDATLTSAAERLAGMDDASRHAPERKIIAGLPGSEESFGTADFQRALDAYAGIDAA